MILIGQSGQPWQYFLDPYEAEMLETVLSKFPFTAPVPAQISQMTSDPAMAEREKLLNETLAEHRRELAKEAIALLGKDTWRKSEHGSFLTLSSHSRELMLQILNDIRVGCWRAQGELEQWDKVPPATSPNIFAYHHLMKFTEEFQADLLESNEL